MKRLLIVACVFYLAVLISCSANKTTDENTANPAGLKTDFDSLYDTPPQALTPIIPVYPTEARKSGIQGTVILEVDVSKTGEVGSIAVQKSVPGLDESALDSVKKISFKPGLLNGKAVDTKIIIPVQFKLN